MARISDLTGANYLAAAEMEGKEVTVRLERITPETLKGRDGGADERKFVAYFQGHKKGLVLNKTNASVLESLGIENTDVIPPDFPTLTLTTWDTPNGKPGLLLKGSVSAGAEVPF